MTPPAGRSGWRLTCTCTWFCKILCRCWALYVYSEYSILQGEMCTRKKAHTVYFNKTKGEKVTVFTFEIYHPSFKKIQYRFERIFIFDLPVFSKLWARIHGSEGAHGAVKYLESFITDGEFLITPHVIQAVWLMYAFYLNDRLFTAL